MSDCPPSPVGIPSIRTTDAKERGDSAQGRQGEAASSAARAGDAVEVAEAIPSAMLAGGGLPPNRVPSPMGEQFVNRTSRRGTSGEAGNNYFCATTTCSLTPLTAGRPWRTRRPIGATSGAYRASSRHRRLVYIPYEPPTRAIGKNRLGGVEIRPRRRGSAQVVPPTRGDDAARVARQRAPPAQPSTIPHGRAIWQSDEPPRDVRGGREQLFLRDIHNTE